MNILYVNTCFWGGGAEKVSRQLYYGLKNEDVKTYFIAGRYQRGVPDDIEIIYETFLERAFSLCMGFLNHNFLFRTFLAKKRIKDLILKEKIDIVHFHNIHGNYISPADIKEIRKYCKNIIFTLHDMWLITGCCFHGMSCDQWMDFGKCKKCRGNEYLKRGTIRARIYLKSKFKNLSKCNFCFVSPSKWLINCCRHSYLRAEDIHWIPNGINIDTFCELEKSAVRKKYQLPLEKRILLFSANELNSPYKGFKYLYDALLNLPQKEQYCLLVVGKGNLSELEKKFETYNMGYIKDERVMNELYSAANLYIIPSMADTFPLTMLESMASGTPVLAFRTGGISEAVNNEVGWSVDAGDILALKKMISYIFENEHEYNQKAQRCRKYIEDNYSENLMLARYKMLYEVIYNSKV